MSDHRLAKALESIVSGNLLLAYEEEVLQSLRVPSPPKWLSELMKRILDFGLSMRQVRMYGAKVLTAKTAEIPSDVISCDDVEP